MALAMTAFFCIAKPWTRRLAPQSSDKGPARAHGPAHCCLWAGVLP